MNKYEFVYIVDAHAPQSTKDEIAKQVAEAMSKAEVKVTANTVWLERHKMSFPIRKIIEGSYYLVNCEAESSSIPKLHGILRINEQILRFLTVRTGTQKAVR
ncbi:MAG: 30S ribosomal protein S6 [Candidatus Omnitrophica bacterium]|nr:30S ribosomal protein S6 [Candidatus Omnitrophota bacterium]MDE2010014.1 30S ribosomal protein S6 [Candidatus Omnitrophota bacterium]MDE2215046.1 30S ribosomal protein S6 [Candidatus Omnitrophota bacterium]MDE2231746.1 30S ribosomal protein S6 [Candidatus Omnitrophota bacterium]